MTIRTQTVKEPSPVLLSRRLVKLLGNYLRHYIEKNTSLPESVSTEERDDLFQFMHLSELESNPPKWNSGTPKNEPKHSQTLAKLATKVDIQYTGKSIKLLLFENTRLLVSLTLGWREIHSLLYALAEMSRKADWNLEGVFEWSGQVLQDKGTNQIQ